MKSYIQRKQRAYEHRLNEAKENYPEYWSEQDQEDETKKDYRLRVVEWVRSVTDDDDAWEDDNNPIQETINGFVEALTDGYSGNIVLAGDFDKPLVVEGEKRDESNAKIMLKALRTKWLEQKGQPMKESMYWIPVFVIDDFAYYLSIKMLKPTLYPTCWGEEIPE